MFESRQSNRGRCKHLFVAGLICLTGAISPGAFGAATDELFADGNRLFRDDLYWAALLRYRQASDAGMNTPLLHYNTGVAHYKAQQYLRARESLLKASRYSGLEVLSHYNLGLNAWALGQTNEALRWLRRARDQERSRKISKLARKAMERIRAETTTEDTVVVRAKAEEVRKDIFDFTLRARVGGAIDSNVFRSPLDPYVDLADATQPLVTPEVQEGFYIPVNIDAKYAVQSFEHESFFGTYRFGGRFYQDEALKNGDEYSHEISFGTEYKRQKDTRKRRVFSAFTFAQHDELYIDRDDGIGRIINNVDITERFNYVRYGPEFTFQQSFNRLAFGFRGKAQLWNYEDPEVVPEYDHEYFLFGLNTQYKFTRTSLVRVTASVYKRRFGDRPSFELDGTQLAGSPEVDYNYIEAGVTARQRVTRYFWFGVNFVRTDREDKHLGYNNYIRNTYGADLHWQPSNRLDISASGSFSVYDYENAFAFQNPLAGRKTLERSRGRLNATFDMTRSLSLVAEYRYDDVQTNDARLAYERSQISLAIRWQSR